MNEREIKRLFIILRDATCVVKAMPFVLALMYTFCIAAYLFTPDNVQYCLDMLFYISPMTILSNVILSRIFRMCRWHLFECLLPAAPQLSVFADFFLPMDKFATETNAVVIFVMFFMSMVNAYFTFLR